MNDANNADDTDDAKDLTGGEGGGAGGGAVRGVAIGCGALVAVPVLLVLGFLVTYSVQRGTPEDYERVAPQAMMTRIGEMSRESYGVLGFGTAAGSDASGDLCYPDGLESMADEPVDGAYALSHHWSVEGVTRTAAVAALKRLHGRLEDEGWHIDSYADGDGGAGGAGAAYGPELRASREGPSDDGGDIRAVFEWRDHEGRFEGGVHAPCAYDPDAGADAGPGSWSAADVASRVEPPELRR